MAQDKGLLLKPERSLSLPYLGEAFAEYERVYVPKSDAKPRLGQALDGVYATRSAKRKTLSLRSGSATFVDLGQFAKFTAAHTVLSHLDSFLLRGHNYYLYLPKADGKFAFLPWDVNSTFASHRSAGSPEQQFDLSVKQPFAKGSTIARALDEAENRSASRTGRN